MANPEHLKILKKGVDHWNKWRKENSEIEPDLSEANFSRAYLSKANFSGAYLSEVNFIGAYLSEANLSKANLSGANLHEADLSKANLSEANMHKAYIYKADLGEADLSETNLNRANLCKANLYKANLRKSDLSIAVLFGADLGIANLSRTDLREAQLHKADLSGADLRGANLIGAVLNEAVFSKADLRGADFRGANLSFAHFSECNCKKMKIAKATLLGTIFVDIDFSNVDDLSKTEHHAKSYIDIETFYKSKGNIPVDFLRKAGIPEDFIKNCLPLIGRNPIEFYSSFISCSEKDILFAQRLYDTLQKRGIRCWLYEKDLKISDKLDKNIIEAIRREDKFILCMSRYSLKSSWVEKEIRTALAKEGKLSKKEDLVVLIPIDIDGFLFSDKCTNIFKEELENRLAAKFEGWELDNTIFDREVEKVIEALRINRGLYDKPPEPKL